MVVEDQAADLDFPLDFHQLLVEHLDLFLVHLLVLLEDHGD